MLEIRSSPATRPNPHFREQARPRRQGNLAWLTRAVGKARPAKPGTALVLLGGDDPVSFRLRVAQSHMRHDLTPSRFSHVVLMEAGGGVADEGWEVSLEPAGGFGSWACEVLPVGTMPAVRKEIARRARFIV